MGMFRKGNDKASEEAQVDLVIDTPTVERGQNVKGRVELTVGHHFPKDALTVELVGREEIFVGGLTKRPEFLRQKVPQSDIEPHLELEHNLIKPGSYTIPLSIELNLTNFNGRRPGSLDLPQPDKTYAKIEYYVEAKLSGSQFPDEHQQRHDIWVKHPEPDENRHITSYDSGTKMHALSKGNYFQQVKMPDQTLLSGENLKVVLIAKNDSETKIEQISATVYCHTSWTSGKAASKNASITEKVDGIVLDSKSKIVQQLQPAGRGQPAYKEDMVEHEFRLTVPHNFCPSYEGSNLFIKYSLEIEVHTKTGMMHGRAQVPKFTHPLSTYYAPKGQ